MKLPRSFASVSLAISAAAVMALTACDAKDNSIPPSSSLGPVSAPNSGTSSNNSTTAGVIAQGTGAPPAPDKQAGPAAGGTAIGGVTGQGGGSSGGGSPAPTAGDGGSAKPAGAAAGQGG
ncbi:MAG: hypothetical protein EON92_08550 [Burkholderiales bacterium]|nr:MAG: hypothetical protein EON92_08550 [Burkholderiales bacterium]